MTFTKFPAVKKFVAVKLKYATMRISPRTTGRTPRFPDLMLPSARCQSPCSSSASSPSGSPIPGATISASEVTRRSPAPSPDSGHLRRNARGDRLDDLLLRGRRALVDTDVAAEAEDGDPGRGLEDVVQVVRDEDDGEPLLGQAPDELEHLLGLRDAERRGRLVEDHELRVPHHRARNGDRLALPTREGRDRLTDGLDRGDAKALERLHRTLLHRRLLEPEEEVPDLAAEVHVLDDVEVVAEREILVHDLDPELRRVLRPVDVHLLAAEEDLAGVVAVDAGDALDERRLSGAVVADERHDLARAHLEVDVGQRLHGAERLREVADLEEWSVAHG